SRSRGEVFAECVYVGPDEYGRTSPAIDHEEGLRLAVLTAARLHPVNPDLCPAFRVGGFESQRVRTRSLPGLKRPQRELTIGGTKSAGAIAFGDEIGDLCVEAAGWSLRGKNKEAAGERD